MSEVLDRGPFFHGTKAELKIGELLKPKHLSNYQDRASNYIYFTATLDAAKWGAELARSHSKERIYVVEPLGDFENDPNVTDKKFPGNPTRSYRTAAPLKIVGEVMDWTKQTSGEIKQWHDKLEKNKGEIIN